MQKLRLREVKESVPESHSTNVVEVAFKFYIA